MRDVVSPVRGDWVRVVVVGDRGTVEGVVLATWRRDDGTLVQIELAGEMLMNGVFRDVIRVVPATSIVYMVVVPDNDETEG